MPVAQPELLVVLRPIVIPGDGPAAIESQEQIFNNAFEQLADGRRVLQAGELLEAGEVELAPGESYTTPECLLCFSDDGMTGLAQQWHRYVRNNYETSASDQVRPVQLNTWEACYFGVNETTVIELIDEAADLGIERFVLDDGWFRNRNNDRTYDDHLSSAHASKIHRRSMGNPSHVHQHPPGVH